MLQLVDDSYRQEVVLTALGMVGSPYRYGGTDPQRGFDCSGLVHYVFNTVAGASVPRTTGSQAAAARWSPSASYALEIWCSSIHWGAPTRM